LKGNRHHLNLSPPVSQFECPAPKTDFDFNEGDCLLRVTGNIGELDIRLVTPSESHLSMLGGVSQIEEKTSR
jgi:hypothetical protein